MAFNERSNGNSNGIRSAVSGSVGKTAKQIGIASPLFAGLDWRSNMAQGDSFGLAGTKALGTALLWHTNPALMWSYTAATAVPAMYKAGVQWKRQATDEHRLRESKRNSGVVGGGYQDTQRALTMRQAAVQAIEGSKMNARSALGGEAKIYKDTWSRYS